MFAFNIMVTWIVWLIDLFNDQRCAQPDQVDQNKY